MRNASTKPLHRAAEQITSTQPRITSTHAVQCRRMPTTTREGP
jgi:hypothetical protein